MGNCYGTGKNNNKVGPEPVNKKIPKHKDTSEILSNATQFRNTSPCEEKAMIQDLARKGQHSTTSKGGQDPTSSKGGLAFNIDYKDGHPERMPSRLADRLDGVVDDRNTSRNDGFVYTAEERELMAELYRADILREKRENAIKEEIKVYDAALRRKRMAEKTGSKVDRATPDITERKLKVKKMADEGRSRAASRMGK